MFRYLAFALVALAALTFRPHAASAGCPQGVVCGATQQVQALYAAPAVVAAVAAPVVSYVQPVQVQAVQSYAVQPFVQQQVVKQRFVQKQLVQQQAFVQQQAVYAQPVIQQQVVKQRVRQRVVRQRVRVRSRQAVVVGY